MLSPFPVAGRPRLFVVPGIDMVNTWCHKRRAGARVRLLAPVLTATDRLEIVMATDAPNTTPEQNAPSLRPSSADLSFVQRHPDGRLHHWLHVAAGAWGEDCSLGRDRGREVASYIRQSGDCSILPAIVRTIAGQGTFGGVEVGFFTMLAMELHG
jgi:hypothetical protein